MKGVDSLAMRVAPWAIPVLTVGVFALDIVSPLGIAVWMFYAVPLLLTVFLPHPRASFYATTIMSLLVVAGLFLSPAGLESPTAFFNRGLGLLLIWGLVWAVTSRKDLRASLAASLSDRRQAETAREAAVEARALSDVALLGAVTGRREAEAQLLSTKLNLDSVIQSAMDAIITVDDSQRVVLFNHAAEQMFGCAAQVAIGQPMDRFIPARFREAHRRHVEGFGHSGTTTRKMGAMGQVRGLRAGGEEFAVEAAISQVRAEGKTYMTVILRDITARQKAEADLKEAEERFRLVALATNDVLWDWDLKTDRHWWSESAKTQFGYDPDREPSIEAWKSRLHPEDRNKVLASVQQAIQSGQAFWFGEYRFLAANGSEAVIFDRGHIVRDPDGIPVRMIGAMIDITERRQAETLLRQSEERYRRLVEVSPDAIFLMRGDRIVFANEQGVRLLGAQTEAQIMGRSWLDFLATEFHDVVRDRLHRLVEGEETVPLKHERVLRLDGTEVDVEVSSARMVEQEGVTVQTVVRDITERQRMLDQLRRTERLAELGTLASGMAHEIGTPMNVIMGRAEHLLQRTTDEKAKKGLQIIVTQVERITKIMNQLLTLARRRPSEQRPADLRRTVDDCVEVLQERFKKHRVHVIKHYEANLPAALVDPDQISQVLLNLLLNADHAMAEGGTLRLGLTSAGDRVFLTVSDTGHGIPNNHLSKIFTPFFTTKEAGKGTGLGLSVVHGIIEEHKGTISVESEVGKGTTFTITVPTARA